MNPFDWQPYPFLAFYLLLGLVLLALQYGVKRSREAEFVPAAATPRLTDPFLASYLAGGVNGLLRCATMMSLERGLLSLADKKKRLQAVAGAMQQVNNPLEGTVVQYFDKARDAVEVFSGMAKQAAVTQLAGRYEVELQAAGFLPTDAQKSANRMNALTVALIMGAVAGARLYLAFLREHHNVGFLITLAIIACVVPFSISAGRQTRRGKEAVEDLKQLFGGLRQKAKAGGANLLSPADVAFVAAIYGVGALGGQRRVYGADLFPNSSSSGCGSSCGGGGCGGGCGGCGG